MVNATGRFRTGRRGAQSPLVCLIALAPALAVAISLPTSAARVDEAKQIPAKQGERVAGGRLVGRLEGSGGMSVAFSGDGRRLLAAGGDAARVWDARTLKPLTAALGHRKPVHFASFKPDATQ